MGAFAATIPATSALASILADEHVTGVSRPFAVRTPGNHSRLGSLRERRVAITLPVNEGTNLPNQHTEKLNLPDTNGAGASTTPSALIPAARLTCAHAAESALSSVANASGLALVSISRP